MGAPSEGPVSLEDFLEEAELDQYLNMFKDYLKISRTTQLKYVNKADLGEMGMSKPEQRRYKKIYSKHFGKHYITRIKRMLSTKRSAMAVEPTAECLEALPTNDSSLKIPTKHIIPVEDITINNELGTGEFGVVQQGTWTNDNYRIQVAIKCLGRDRLNYNSMEFLKEAAVMHSINHPNVVRLYGVVLHPESLMLVTELAPLRSLLECLKEFALRDKFPVMTLCNYAEQICNGMTYLESKRLIHRDLAARNILVFDKNKVKISDFGLSRALGVGKDYYQTNYNVNLKLPVAWCAPECVNFLKFTTASDVWAFAVTMWEMFSYGFQPWVAFSGHQILTAIDAPLFQRLERPECCPEEHYSTMLECWSHDPDSRPRFKDLKHRLRHIQPQQVTTKTNSPQAEGRRATLLTYKAGDVITVIGKERLTKCSMWSGALTNGSCGLFDPDNVTPYIPPNAALSPSTSQSSGAARSAGGLLSSTLRSSLIRSDSKRQSYASKRAVQRPMISSPQGEVKHTGHVGLDGAYFGDVSFLSPAGCADLPRQIVNPYRPSEDLEETPLLNPNSPSHLTGGASSTPPYHLVGEAPGPPPAGAPGRDEVDDASKVRELNLRSSSGQHQGFKTLPPKASKSLISMAKSATLGKSFQHHGNVPCTSKNDATETQHDYHEILENHSAFEDGTSDSLGARKSQTEFSQSLINKMESMIQSLNIPEKYTENQLLKKCNPTNSNAHTLGKKKPNSSEILKPMSAHEQKTLETAVALANELTTRSMNDLALKSEKVPPSPSERSKFHFKFPSIVHPHSSQEHVKEGQGKQERRNFSQEAESVPDLQSTITEESRLAYASLIEQPSPAQARDCAALYAPRQARGSVATDSIRYRYFASNMDPEHEANITDDNRGPNGHAVNVLPLPCRGNKPTLIEKPRHIRVHPLVMTDPTKQSNHNDHRGKPTALVQPPTARVHDYQNFLNMHPASRDRNSVSTVSNDMLNGHQRNKKSHLEPDYENIHTNNVLDCSGPSRNLERDIEPLEGDETDSGAVRESSDADGAEHGASCGQPSAQYDLGLLLKDAPDHVSLEDLLEFADLRPLGRQLGAESDEVRLLTKMLNWVTEEQCLRVLDYTEWSVHEALKVFRLRSKTGYAAELGACARALQAASGDIAQALAALQAPGCDADP